MCVKPLTSDAPMSDHTQTHAYASVEAALRDSRPREQMHAKMLKSKTIMHGWWMPLIDGEMEDLGALTAEQRRRGRVHPLVTTETYTWCMMYT